MRTILTVAICFVVFKVQPEIGETLIAVAEDIVRYLGDELRSVMAA